MAQYTGAVRFPDGGLMYFVYLGTTGIARPRLFASADQAFDAWGDKQGDVPRHEGLVSDELIEVMPYFCHGSQEISFLSRANRELGRITGVLSLDEATMD